MSDLAKIPVTVITGFLGSGKTTLIRHLMQNPQGKRLVAEYETEFANPYIAADRGLITHGPEGRRSQGTLSDLRPHRTSLQALAA
mgnify:CR=1 FL=1